MDNEKWDSDFKLLNEQYISILQACANHRIRYKRFANVPFQIDFWFRNFIRRIDEALHLEIVCPNNASDVKWKAACSIVMDLKALRAEVVQAAHTVKRLSDNNVGDTKGVLTPNKNSKLAEALSDLQIPIPNGNAAILISCDGVQLYFIASEGQVEALGPQRFTIYMLQDGTMLVYWLEIGDFIYPLVPGVSPCYRTEYQAFIFPDVADSEKSVGIVVPPDADDAVLQILSDILLGVVSKRIPEDRLPKLAGGNEPTIGDKMAMVMKKGASLVANGLRSGANNVGLVMDYATSKVIVHTPPAPSDVPIPAGLAKGVKVAKDTTGKAVEVTEATKEAVGTSFCKMGRFLAPHIEQMAKQLEFSEETNNAHEVLTVVAGALESGFTIYEGLSTSAEILGQNLKDNSAKIVAHKFGQPAGDVVNDTLSTAGNAMAVTCTVKPILKPIFAKGLLNGKTLVHHEIQQAEHAEPASKCSIM